MSKALNPESNWLIYSEEASAKELLGDQLEIAASKTSETWSNLGNKVIGGVLYLIIVSADAKNDKYALGQQMNFLPLGQTQGDQEVFNAFCEMLQSLKI